MDRREFLSLISLGGVAIPLGASIGREEAVSGEATIGGSKVRDLLPHLDGGKLLRQNVELIGRAYLRSHPEAADAASLSVLTSRDRRDLEVSKEATLETMVRLLNREIRSDFENGRTVHIDGWILSQTEARLCALTVCS